MSKKDSPDLQIHTKEKSTSSSQVTQSKNREHPGSNSSLKTNFFSAAWHYGCSYLHRMGNGILKIRWIRRLWHVWERTPPFFKVIFSKNGLLSAKGRTLIRGKFRRAFFSLIPSVAHQLQKHYGLEGGCQHCSTSCKLLFQCPHWDDSSSRCGVYEDRPNICRTFPITPQDIKDRDLCAPESSCGFTFLNKK